MARSSEKMIQFTEVFDKKAADDANKKVASGLYLFIINKIKIANTK